MKFDGLELFRECLRHPEKLIDDFYTSDQLIISQDVNSPPTKAMQTWRLMLDRITAAKVALDDEDDSQLEHHLQMLDKCIMKRSHAQLSEFTTFFSVIDMSCSIYRKLDHSERIEFLREAFTLYVDRRHHIYTSHGFTPTTIQVRKDASKSGRSGNMGTNKVRAMFAEVGYQEEDSIINKSKRFSIITKRNRRLLQDIQEIGASCYNEWSAKHQGKTADVMFVDENDRYYICEMKHIKELGGAQDKQITELIEFINNQGDSKVSYIAYLDGIYFNRFVGIGTTKNKIKEQRDSIKKCLSDTPSNYFLNTHGFKRLIG